MRPRPTDFKPLYRFQTVMGMEASPEKERGEKEPSGLCNAVILSAPYAPFIVRPVIPVPFKSRVLLTLLADTLAGVIRRL
jgi:hypothetical protein